MMTHHTSTFKLRLPTSEEFDEMLYLTHCDDDLCHWKKVFTLCQDPFMSASHLTRGYFSCYTRDYAGNDFRNVRLGFRPFLAFAGDPQESHLSDGSMMSFGVLTLDGHLIHIPQNPVAPTSFYMGDIPRGYERRIDLIPSQSTWMKIKWIKEKGGLIADRVLVCNLSWNTLARDGLDSGREVHFTLPESAGFSMKLPHSK